MSFFEREFEEVGDNDRKEVYKVSGILSNKEYKFDLQEGEIDEVCTATSAYRLFFFLSFLLAIIGLYGRFSQRPFLQNWCLLAGIFLIGQFIYSLLRYHEIPSFFHTPSGVTKILASPRVVRYNASPGLPNVLNIILGFVCIQPWLIPIENILMWVAIPNIMVVILLKIEQGVDPVTVRVMLLATIANAILGISVGNILLYSQPSAFINQDQIILSMIASVGSWPPELQNMVFQAYIQTMTDLTNVPLFMNVFILFLIFVVSKSLFTGSFVLSSNTTIPTELSDNTYLRYGICMCLVSNLGLLFTFPLSQFLNYQIGPKLSMSQFAVFYAPTLLITFIWCVFFIYSIIHSRKVLLGLQKNGKVDVTKPGPDLIINDLDKRRAVAVDLLGKEEFVLIDTQLYDSLDSNQIDAIYHHELHHIQQESRARQILFRIPLMGYIFALFFVNPAEIYEREIKADRRAAENVNPTAVKEAIEEVDQTTTLNVIQTNKNGSESQWWEFIKTLFRIPLSSMYRPSKEHRIARLEELNDKSE